MDKGLITHHICQIRFNLRMKRIPDKPSRFFAMFFTAGVIHPVFQGIFSTPCFVTLRKAATPAFGDPFLGCAHCVWPFQMLIHLPDEALSVRESLLPSGLLMANVNARKFPLLFPDPVLLSVCTLLIHTHSHTHACTHTCFCVMD